MGPEQQLRRPRLSVCAMKQPTLSRKHKVALTSGLEDADEKVIDDLVASGLVERGGPSGLRLTDAGKMKKAELELALGRPKEE